MPHPIAFLIAAIVLASVAAVFVLLTPGAVLWLEQFPAEAPAVIGGGTGAIVVLLTYMFASERRRQRRLDDWAAARESEARSLAAAMKGEMIVLGQWLAAQADALGNAPHENPSRSNLDMPDFGLQNEAARIVYHSNATRLALLGPDLAAAIAYCHARFERAESDLAAPANAGGGSEIALLRALEVKFNLTIRYLDAFIAEGPVVFNASNRKMLLAPLESGV